MVDDRLAAYAEPDKARRGYAVKRLSAEDAQPIDPPLAAQGHA